MFEDRDAARTASPLQDGLSASEVTVARMLAWGFAGSEIATRLGWELSEVATQATSLRARYAVSGTMSAVREAYDRGDLFPH